MAFNCTASQAKPTGLLCRTWPPWPLGLSLCDLSEGGGTFVRAPSGLVPGTVATMASCGVTAHWTHRWPLRVRSYAHTLIRSYALTLCWVAIRPEQDTSSP